MPLGRAGSASRLGLRCDGGGGGLPVTSLHPQRGAGVVSQHRCGRVGANALAVRRRATLRLRRRCALRMKPAPSPTPNPNPDPNHNPNYNPNHNPNHNPSHNPSHNPTLTRRALRMEPARPAATRALRHLPGAGGLDGRDRESPLRRHQPRRPPRLPAARPGGGAHGDTAAQPKGDLNEIWSTGRRSERDLNEIWSTLPISTSRTSHELRIRLLYGILSIASAREC